MSELCSGILTSKKIFLCMTKLCFSLWEERRSCFGCNARGLLLNVYCREFEWNDVYLCVFPLVHEESA